LRIFYAADTSPNESLSSSIWRNNLYLPLVDLGHDVIEFNYDGLHEAFQFAFEENPSHRRFIEKNRPRLTATLLDQVKAAHSKKSIDIFFSYFYDSFVFPDAIDEIRGMGITTINWFCNGSYQLFLVEEISKHYDWCLVPERFRLQDYVRMGANPIYCQEAANPNVYKPYDVPVEFDVAFVGQAYGERPEYIGYLLEQDIDVRVWGANWHYYSDDETKANPRRGFGERLSSLGHKLSYRHGQKELLRRVVRDRVKPGQVPAVRVKLPDRIIGGVLTDRDMIKMYSRARINLGFSTCGDTHLSGQRILQVRLRDFEVPMSGGFYMVEYMEEIEEFFKVGEEIVCYQNAEDLADKIKYYLRHDNERESIRRAGYERSRRDHTWHKRFQSVFQQMLLQPA
jgi:spore maturation protein CgeB